VASPAAPLPPVPPLLAGIIIDLIPKLEEEKRGRGIGEGEEDKAAKKGVDGLDSGRDREERRISRWRPKKNHPSFLSLDGWLEPEINTLFFRPDGWLHPGLEGVY